jgi:hypothetical protein
MNILNDISKVYLETIATEAAKPDYLDFDKDGNKKESMKKALKDKKEVAEAVRGQDTEMRKAASAERRAGDTLTKKLPPSEGKNYGKYQGHQISYIDKKTKGKHIPGMTRESLDPVGKEDKDIDNDGDHDKSDKYLLNRRKVRGTAIATRKESFSNWRQDLSEVMDKIEKDDDHKQIKEKKNINNKIVINPDFKEAVEELGGVLLESVEVDEAFVDPEHGETPSGRTPLQNVSDHPKASVRKTAVKGFKKQMEKEYGGKWKSRSNDPVSEELEVDEAYKPIDKDKENRMYRRAGNLARTAVSSTGKKKEVAQKKSSKIVSAITRQKEKERFDRIGQSPAHNEEYQLDEKTLTPAETKKKEQIVKSMKKSAGDFEKRYPGRGKEVMYATATKQAKKLAEAESQDPAEKKVEKQQQQRMLQLLQQKQRAVRSGVTGISASYEPEGEVIDERRREEKGTPRKPRDRAFEMIAKSMGSARAGVQPRGEKKVPGKKQPSSGQSPAQRVAMRRASAQRAQDMMHSPRD